MSCKIGTQCFIDKNGIDLENKRIPLILSDETKVLRFNWEDGIYDLILEHSEDAIDMSRKDILPILLQHNTNMLPLGIYEDLKLEQKKLKAIAQFDSEDEQAMLVFGKMSRGFMPTVSVGVTIHEKILFSDENGKKTYKATKWEITEASIVTVPANPNAKVGFQVAAMPDASVPKLANKTIGADMKFDRENLDDTEAKFNALVGNRDTLTRRIESLDLKLQTSQTALATKTEEFSALQAEMTSKVSEAEGKLASFEENTVARIQEAIATKVPLEVALAMVKADSAESATTLALAAKSNTEALRQGEGQGTKKGAWDDFKIRG